MTDDGALILLKQFRKDWTRYGKAFKRAKSGLTEESVHDLRVALRRLDAILGLIRLFGPESDTKRARKRIATFRKRLNPLRDIHVQLLRVAEYAEVHPELEKFRKRLSKREKSLIRDLKKNLATNHRKLEKAVRVTVARSQPLLRAFTFTEAERTVDSGADAAYAAVVTDRQAMDPSDVASIHRVRVAFKKFRYLLQAAQPLLRDTPEITFERMHAFQDLFGAIQDADVFFETLTTWGRKQKKKVQSGLAPAYASVAQRRRDSIEQLLSGIHELEMFWPPTRPANEPANR
jgi:CHAD domain-containing protein